jgi:hypothetical protein
LPEFPKRARMRSSERLAYSGGLFSQYLHHYQPFPLQSVN